MPLSEVKGWKKKRQRKIEKEQRNDLQNYSERVRNTVLLFCLKKEREKISRMDITKHFWESENEKLAGGSLNISVSGSSFSSQLSAAKELTRYKKNKTRKRSAKYYPRKSKKMLATIPWNMLFQRQEDEIVRI